MRVALPTKEERTQVLPDEDEELSDGEEEDEPLVDDWMDLAEDDLFLN